MHSPRGSQSKKCANKQSFSVYIRPGAKSARESFIQTLVNIVLEMEGRKEKKKGEVYSALGKLKYQRITAILIMTNAAARKIIRPRR